MKPDARYLMVGGFLGAGKTTAIARLGRWLSERGSRVGLITNDQSTHLVDTAILRRQGFSVEEIAGGCFCCRFHSLEEAVAKLDADSAPDVFLAEPVGSCTDLVATVSYPLRRIYGERFAIGPLSVLVDPQRAARVLGLEPGRSFSRKVAYVYEKQLEEADLIVVNKADVLARAARGRLVAELERRFPHAGVRVASAKAGEGLDAWFGELLESGGGRREAMALEYRRYAEGEALLGWLNATLAVRSAVPFDANALLLALVEAVRARLAGAGVEIAHLKATLEAPDGEGQLAVVGVTTSEGRADVRESLLDRVDAGDMIVNLRAEADPELLESALRASLAAATSGEPGLALTVEHLERFRPAAPVPVHRLQVAP